MKTPTILLITCAIISGTIAYGQQKASQKTFASELNKINQKQQARLTMLVETQQVPPGTSAQATTQKVDKSNQQAQKTSSKAMTLPVRRKDH